MLLWIVVLLSVLSVANCTPVACNETRTMVPGTQEVFASPGFPAKYTPPLLCTYTFVVPAGYRLQLTCSPNELEATDAAHCANNSITTNGIKATCPLTSTVFMVNTAKSALVITFNSATVQGRYNCNATLVAEPCACGKKRADGEFRHTAFLSVNNTYYCGATIISNRVAVTAASCIKTDTMFLLVGSDTANAQQYLVAASAVLSNYDPVTHKNDIGLIDVGAQMIFNENVGPACLFIGVTRGTTIPQPTTLSMVKASDFKSENTVMNFTPTQCGTVEFVCTTSAATPGCGFLLGSGMTFVDLAGVGFLGGISTRLNCTGQETGMNQNLVYETLDSLLGKIVGQEFCKKNLTLTAA